LSLSLSKIVLPLWNSKVLHRVHKSPPLYNILNQPNSFRPIDPCLHKDELNVFLPPMPRSYQWSPDFGPPNQKPVNTSPLSYASHMSRSPQPPSFNHANNIRWRIQAMKFINVQFSPRSVFVPSGLNILLNTLFSKTFSLHSSLKVRDKISHPYSTTGKLEFIIF